MRSVLVTILALALIGCTEFPAPAPIAPAPVGPRALTADLRPWTKDAPTITFTGWLQNFYVATSTGPVEYVTWSVHTGMQNACELDIRGCPQAAAMLVNQRVAVTGRLIEREGYHFPLLVAETIEPASESTQMVASGF